ncbi:shikimate kinase [Pseudochryseolinea flava]|uniref:Shikimate kinase n=1 Tax=Pseudochryseolinea flava TaxID=2059302 RepID=A0A364XZ74_9BACT|nr:shikimate kinase [Pseudochryseolinea flava]RAV99783.1 shikimate kinase [Pseudochryseolinea flava]
MKIFLIGMPGSGKSTLGRPLAQALNLPFVDLDKEIERQEQQTIPDIFASHGEDHFRNVESSALKQWAFSSKDFVLATGGGAPCFHSGIDIINQHGLSIFLDVTVDELLRRIGVQSGRPLLGTDDLKQKEEKLAQLYAKRRDIYLQAKITLVEPTLAQLMEAIYLKK